MLHTLFTLEHNYICDLLAHQNPNWNDEQLYRKAKLINSALMAKIHTVEWTPAIVPHPIIKHGDERQLVGPGRRGSPGRAGVPRRQGAARRHRRLERRSPHRAVLAHRGVRVRLPHAPADAGRVRVPLAGHRRAARETRRSTRSPASARRRSPSASRCRICSTRSASAIRARSRCTTIPAPAEPDARQRRAARSADGRHPARSRARRAALQPVPPAAAQAAGEVVRRADRQRRRGASSSRRSTTTTSSRST